MTAICIDNKFRPNEDKFKDETFLVEGDTHTPIWLTIGLDKNGRHIPCYILKECSNRARAF